MANISKPVVARRALFELVWSKPMTHVASDFGTTGAHVRALCDRLNLPVPVQGYWMKLEAGKAPAKPAFPADPSLDDVEHEVSRPRPRRPKTAETAADDLPPGADHGATEHAPGTNPPPPGPERDHKLVRKTRAALTKAGEADRLWVAGNGKFRVHASAAVADRICLILSTLAFSVEDNGWKFHEGQKGLEIAIDDDTLSLSIEERADVIPHELSPKEERQKAEYERKHAIYARGLGHWPGYPPQIPQADYKPNGQLVLKLDDGIRIEGLRRTFSDGKKQRLEDLVPNIAASLECWSRGMKQWHEQQERWHREAEEREEQRRAAECRARMDGYRLTFIRKQSTRLDEVASIDRMIAHWSDAGSDLPHLRLLIEWAEEYRQRLLSHVSAEAAEARISHLRLMKNEAYIYEGQID